MINASLKELSAALAGKKISSVELATLFLDRIEALNPQLNAFITVDRDKSLAMARAADTRLARGEAGALTGIPLAHKDIFCAEGWLTTCGSKILSNFVSPYDATVIERFKAAGTVTLGGNGRRRMARPAVASFPDGGCTPRWKASPRK